jgi:hypothetical protein
MNSGISMDNYCSGRKSKIQKSLTFTSIAFSIAAILTIIMTSAIHYHTHILDVYPQLNIKSVEAISSVYATTAGEANDTTSSNKTTSAPNFSRNYVNTVFGLSAEYPSSWSAFELNSRFRDNVTYAVALLRAPLENVSDKYPERINFNLQTFRSNNVTLDAYTSAILRAYENITDVKIVDSSPATLAGQPAHRVVYTDDRVEGLKLMKNQVWTVINNSKAYVITFGAEESKYPSYLPQVQDILRSLKITSSSDNPQEKRELTFDDPMFGIKLQYPSTWTKIQLGQPQRSNVDLITAFFHRENQNSSILRIGIATQQLPQEGNLEIYTSNQLNAIKRVNATGIEDDKDTVADIPAHNAVFNLNNTKVMQKWLLKGDKAYILAYQASPDEYAKNLATFQKIADSLEISK